MRLLRVPVPVARPPLPRCRQMAAAFVMLVGDVPDQVFIEISLQAGDNVARFTGRACEKLGLGAGAPSRCPLFRVPDEARARAIQRNPSSATDILLGEPLFASDAVEPGSWLLARVSLPPAAEPSASRRRRAESERRSLSLPLTPRSHPYCGKSLQSGKSMLRCLIGLLNFIRLQQPHQLRQLSADSRVRSLTSASRPAIGLLHLNTFPSLHI